MFPEELIHVPELDMAGTQQHLHHHGHVLVRAEAEAGVTPHLWGGSGIVHGLLETEHLGQVVRAEGVSEEQGRQETSKTLAGENPLKSANHKHISHPPAR